MGFLNELAAGSILFAKNMMGFYVLEGLIKEWSLRGIDCSYEALIKEAMNAPGFGLQAVATGRLDSVNVLHELIKTSFPGTIYSPPNSKKWDKLKEQRKGL